MNKDSIINKIDFVTLILVLSFLFIHKIYLVIIGILLSLYSINKDSITNYITHNKNKRIFKDDIKLDNSIKIDM